MSNRTARFLIVTITVLLTLIVSAGNAVAYLSPSNPAVLSADPDQIQYMDPSYTGDFTATPDQNYQIGPGSIPDYLTNPNWAYTPPIRKFIDKLPLTDCTALNSIGQCVPVAVPDIVTYPGSDYYEIEVVEFTEQMHSDLPATTVRAYHQLNAGTDTSACVDPVINPNDPNNCTAANNTDTSIVDAGPHMLGPIIVNQKDRPVRIKFVNNLPIGAAGRHFLPVDTSIMGAGPFEIDYDPVTKEMTPVKTGDFTHNRALLHLHGGRTPWISDGTPHQWNTPAGETTDYPQGVSMTNVPDMPDPGPGAQTYYYTNQQSSRLLFYHDHSWGITRLGVYAGGAAGFIIRDDTEKTLIDNDIIPGTKSDGVSVAYGGEIPLVLQDRTFVDANTIAATDPTWKWGTDPVNDGEAMRPVTGDLWWPHVYMPAQNPTDITGIAPMGRWAYGPYFWPATNNHFQPIPNPYYAAECTDTSNPAYNPFYCGCDPTDDTTPGSLGGFCQGPEMPSTPNPSWGAEAFMDTPTINSTAYPVLEVEPKAYRFRILNASHDRFFNLQMYIADPNPPVPQNTPNPPYPLASTYAAAGDFGLSNTLAPLTEVRMLPATPDNASLTTAPPGGVVSARPDTWPTDGRPGGVPDWSFAGPDWIMIGNDAGFLPRPVVIPNQPIEWNADVTTFNAGNVNGGSLIMAPAERTDVIVDFSQYAGQTLILYNDAPAPWPALDPHYDYYTDAPDNRDMGGTDTTPIGFGPNIRTMMQIKVANSAPDAAFPLAQLTAEFDPTTAVVTNNGVFQDAQDTIIAGQGNFNPTGDPALYEAFLFDGTDFGAYEQAYNQANNFKETTAQGGVAQINSTQISFFNPEAGAIITAPLEKKAIQDEQGETFDEFGRMRAGLGLTVANPQAGQVNFVVQTYSDPSTEILQQDGIQVWKITHNGVDTHPVHFHLFDVQLLNRVGWDGFLRLPDPTELGWKDTIRISPLEDTIVAIRPITPLLPFGVPESVRPLNPATTLGDATHLSAVDPITGEAWLEPNLNRFINLDWEYVWHCHILSHEENDMMRPISFEFVEGLPDAPTNLTATALPNGDVQISWTDPTPVDFITRTNFGNPKNEVRFQIERFDNGVWSPLGVALANATTFTDTTAVGGTQYAYRVYGANATDVGQAMGQLAPGAISNTATIVAPEPPIGSILINGGAVTTSSFYVALTLSATDPDGVSQMQFSKDSGTTWTTWEPYATNRNVSLSPAGEGIKTITVRFMDNLGNISTPYSASIEVDQSGPTGSILINGGATTTSSFFVALSLSATDVSNVHSMQFSKDGGTTWTGWEPYATTRNVSLSPSGEGIKTIAVRFKDTLGNISTPYSASIEVDQSGPTGTILINGGAATTSSLYVTLSLSATDVSNVHSMQFSKDDGTTWTAWEPYATSRNVSLSPAGEGIKTIAVRYKDNLGNISTPYSAAIEVDQSGPTGTIQINGGALTTTSLSATITLSATDVSGIAMMQFSKDGGTTWTAWEAYSTTRNVTLAPVGLGLKTIDVRFKDSLGNISSRIQASITVI